MMGTLALLHLGSRLLSTNHDLLSTSSLPSRYSRRVHMLAGARFGDARMPTSRVSDGSLRPYGSRCHPCSCFS